jgi:hypothetical protein
MIELGVAIYMKSKEGKEEIVVFSYWIYYNRLFFNVNVCVCELSEISMKGMRELLVP